MRSASVVYALGVLLLHSSVAQDQEAIAQAHGYEFVGDGDCAKQRIDGADCTGQAVDLCVEKDGDALIRSDRLECTRYTDQASCLVDPEICKWDSNNGECDWIVPSFAFEGEIPASFTTCVEHCLLLEHCTAVSYFVRDGAPADELGGCDFFVGTTVASTGETTKPGKGFGRFNCYRERAPTAQPTVSTAAPSVSTLPPLPAVTSAPTPGQQVENPTSNPTLSPVVSTSAPSAATASPTASTYAPSASTSSPTASTYAPTAATAQPTASTYAPSAATSSPSVATEGPTASTLAPSVSTGAPSALTLPPLPTITSAPTPGQQGGNPTASPTVSPTASTFAPSASTAEPTAATAQPTVSTSSPSAATAQPTASTFAPSASTQAPTAATAQPTASTFAPSASTQGPTAATAQPTASTSSPSAATAQPTASTSAPSASTAAPTAATEQPTVSTSSPSAATAQPTASTSAPSASTPRPTAATPAPSVATPRPTAATPRPTAEPTAATAQPTAATRAPSSAPTGSPKSSCPVGISIDSPGGVECECSTFDCSSATPFLDSNYKFCGRCDDRLVGATQLRCPVCVPLQTQINLTCPNSYEACDILLVVYQQPTCSSTQFEAVNGGFVNTLPELGFVTSSCMPQFCGGCVNSTGGRDEGRHRTVTFFKKVLGGETEELPATGTDPTMYFTVVVQESKVCESITNQQQCNAGPGLCAFNTDTNKCETSLCPVPRPPAGPPPPICCMLGTPSGDCALAATA